MAEEEVLMEVEAVEAVYGEDCSVLHSFPPHLHIHIKPRTADVSAQQFVEVLIGIRAGTQYPEEPPYIDLIESKGLDEQREKYLITCIQEKALEMSSSLMLVALCEEAVEKLSLMNHPDGNCPLCLCPLVPDDENETMSFMKLMSCFHCFHSECIIRWWEWMQKERQSNTNTLSTTTLQSIRDLENQNDAHGVGKESVGTCPVCRKVFHAEDLEHVLNLVGKHSHQLGSDDTEVVDDELLQSDSENIRRQKYEAILKLQQENSGLIQPKGSLAVFPGMFLPQPVTLPTQASSRETAEQQPRYSKGPKETSSGSSSRKPRSIQHRNSGRNRQKVQNSGKQVSQWVRKENGAAS